MEQITYKIGEAAALLNLKAYVLRFWETEFPQISPLRTDKRQRLYTEKDITLLRRIRFLLHERGLTIEGARRILAEENTLSTTGSKSMRVSEGFIESLDEAHGERDNEITVDGDDKRDSSSRLANGLSAWQSATASQNIFYQSILNELEDVAALLRGYSKSGSYLQ